MNQCCNLPIINYNPSATESIIGGNYRTLKKNASSQVSESSDYVYSVEYEILLCLTLVTLPQLGRCNPLNGFIDYRIDLADCNQIV